MNFWLPELNPDPALGNGTCENGKFYSIDKSIRELADTIKVPEDTLSEIRSIPDVWARAMLYQDVFTTYFQAGEKTPPPEYINGLINQWRGLLTAIILQEHYGLTIEFNKVDLRTRTGIFINDVKLLLPQSTPVIMNTSWDSPYLIILKTSDPQGNKYDTPLGATSPTTLFYPSASIGILTCLGWYDKDTGLSIDKLTNTDKYVLFSWLGWAKKQIPNTAIHLAKIIDDFSEDLSDSIGSVMQDGKINGGSVKFTTAAGNDPAISLLKVKYSSQYSPTGAESDYYLKRNSKVIVIPDPACIGNKSEFIFGIYDIASYERNEFYKNYIKEVINNADIKIFGQSEVFYNRIVYFISNENTKSTSGMSCKVDYYVKTTSEVDTGRKDGTRSAVVFPIHKESIEYMDFKDCSVSVYESQLKASVVVLLADNREVEFLKYYNSDRVIQLENFPATAIWPRMKLAQWEHYYLYAAITTEAGNKYKFEVDNPSKDIVKRLKKFPDYLVLTENDQPIGCIPISADEESIVNSSNTLNVGIDFGTSSTTVYQSITNDSGRPKQLIFESELAIICCMDSEKKQLVKNFMTPNTNQVPFPTLLAVSDLANVKNERILISSNNYYFKSMDNRTDSDLKSEVKKIMGRIKWDDNNIYASAFISQLVLQAALFARINGYTNVAWYFSYPLSLKDPSFFRTACKEACICILKGTGVNFNDHNSDTDVHFMTESAASAKYFLNGGQHQGVTAPLLIIDIGGGSTDIYLQIDSQNAIQSSLPIGARKMLVELFSAKKKYFFDLLKEVYDADKDRKGITKDCLKNEATFLDFFETEKDVDFTVFVETAFDDKYDDRYTYGDELGKKVVASNNYGSSYLRSITMLYMSSIFYYCGLLLRSRLQTNKNVSICVAGNGSKIVRWVRQNINDSTTEISKSGIIRSLSTFLCEGAELKNDINFQWTEKPKEEVTYGLIHGSRGEEDEAEAEEIIVSGISGKLNGIDVGALDDIISKQITSSSDDDGVQKRKEQVWSSMEDFEEFYKFVKLYNKIAPEYKLKLINLENRTQDRDNYITVTKQTIENRTKTYTQGRSSPFIEAVKALAGEMLTAWKVQ